MAESILIFFFLDLIIVLDKKSTVAHSLLVHFPTPHFMHLTVCKYIRVVRKTDLNLKLGSDLTEPNGIVKFYSAPPRDTYRFIFYERCTPGHNNRFVVLLSCFQMNYLEWFALWRAFRCFDVPNMTASSCWIEWWGIVPLENVSCLNRIWPRVLYRDIESSLTWERCSP